MHGLVGVRQVEITEYVASFGRDVRQNGAVDQGFWRERSQKAETRHPTLGAVAVDGVSRE